MLTVDRPNSRHPKAQISIFLSSVLFGLIHFDDKLIGPWYRLHHVDLGWHTIRGFHPPAPKPPTIHYRPANIEYLNTQPRQDVELGSAKPQQLSLLVSCLNPVERRYSFSFVTLSIAGKFVVVAKRLFPCLLEDASQFLGETLTLSRGCAYRGLDT